MLFPLQCLFVFLSSMTLLVFDCQGIKDPCSRGRFGYNCSFDCHCKVLNECETDTGWCEHGCQDGWSGIGCQARDVAPRGKTAMIAGNQEGFIGPTRDCEHFGRCVQVKEFFHSIHATVGPHHHCTYTRDARVQPWWLVVLDTQYVITTVLLLTTRQAMPVEIRVGNNEPSLFHQNPLCASTHIKSGENEINCSVATLGRVLSVQNMMTKPSRLQICALRVIAYDYVESCPARLYGPACLRKCRCFQSDEACDHVNGSCVTGCASEYIGPACETDFLINTPPIVKTRTSESIELTWAPLAVSVDSRRGDADIRYDVEIMDQAWRRVNDVYFLQRDQHYWVNVTGLKAHSPYKLRVMVSRRGYGNVVSRSVTTAETDFIWTLCSVPTEVPEILSMETSVQDASVFPTSTKMTVQWMPITDGHIQCDAVAYYYIQYRVRAPAYMVQYTVQPWSEVHINRPNGTTYTDIERLLPFTLYDVRIGVVNSAGHNRKGEILVTQTTEGVGGTIRNLRVNSSETTICMMWFPPSESYGVILANYIKYQEIEILGCAMLDSAPTTIIETTRRSEITGLAPNRRFKVSVCASTAVGCGPDAVAEINTKETLPRTKPPVPSIVSLLADSVRIQLYHLSCVERQGVFRSFKIYITDDMTGAIITRGSDSSIVDVYSLKPYTRYRARYSWINTVGSGPASDFVNFTTAEDIPTAPYIKRYTSSSTMISISWAPPRSPNGLVRRYLLRCVLHGHGQLMQETGPETLQHTFERNIKPHHTYRCQVKAATSSGYGEWSTQQMIKTAYSGYYPVRMLSAPFCGPTWIYFVWKEPIFSAEVIGYTMKCIVTANDTVVAWREMNHFKGASSYNLTLLEPDSRYECTVQTVGLEGISLSSRVAVVVRTDPLPPPPVMTSAPIESTTDHVTQNYTVTQQTTTEEVTMSNLVV